MKLFGYEIIHILHFLLLLCFSVSDSVESLGINYGQVGNNLPQPDTVLSLITSMRLTKARIYDTNPQILTTFANSGVELIVTVENNMLATLINPQQALQWVTTHIKPYFPATKIIGISVGNEVFTDPDTSLTSYVVPAMISVHNALSQLGLSSYIQVLSPTSAGVLQESYPPSAGSFKPELVGVMTQYLHFLQATNGSFWLNAYPYFAYKDNPTKISLDYVLFNPNAGMVDPNTKLHYDNMLYAQVDAVIFANWRLGFGGLDVRVSETGWPSMGDPNEIGATIENAAAYNKNLVRRQLANQGTPLRPNKRLEVYVFALFNEDMKPGPTSERNYGLFHPDCRMTYNVGLTLFDRQRSSNPSTSISLTSSASKATYKGYQSLIYWTFVYLVAWQLLIRRPT
ncbi:glucan endo-1,3-beta-glucosidase 11-like [Amaranthus tricolor]|uniref:glucan endo-1,3-beta-glucosidase 11-like n=1 Tax=Amaranthus tricolor TaxID=29722 RepID=UPI002586597A|nr:glucan endo-1,3-beta-glucosidase 11-like [Amaranthus tricolor]